MRYAEYREKLARLDKEIADCVRREDKAAGEVAMARWFCEEARHRIVGNLKPLPTMVGGIVTSFILELLIYPAVYEIWRWRSLRKSIGSEEGVEAMELQTAASSAETQWGWRVPARRQESSEN